MKKICYTLLVLLLFTSSYSQNLTLSELLSLRKKNLAEVEEYLTAKGWEYSSSKEVDEIEMESISFAYKNDYTNNEEKAESFLGYYYHSVFPSRISIQIHRREKYLQYITAVKKYNPKLIKSYTTDDSVVKVYQGKSTTFLFKTKKSEFEVSDNYYIDGHRSVLKDIWFLQIFDNEDYNNMFNN